MGFVQVYELSCDAGDIPALLEALQALSRRMATNPIRVEVEILQGTAADQPVLFLERWPSAEAYEEGKAHLGREDFAPLMAIAKGVGRKAYRSVPAASRTA